MKTLRKGILAICLFLLIIPFLGASAESGITLPADVKTIEDEAFYGVPMQTLRLPDGVTSIGSKAFAHTGLEIIYLPRSVQHIEPDAFEGCDDLIPAVYENSYADQWCQDQSITPWKIVCLGVDTHTQDEIRAFVSAHPAETSSKTTYRRSPSVDPYVPGLISEESTQNAINMLNQVRFIAGLNADVANDPDKEEMMAAAAMVIELGEFSHYPDRPTEWADSSYDDLFQLALSGTLQSNLYAGMTNLANSILGYMLDSDSSNIDRVGHRRWILNPSMGKTAFGYYADRNYYDGIYGFSGMYAFDSSGSGRQAPVAWPAQQTPISHFIRSSLHAWSVSFGYRLTASAIHVAVIRNSDGKTWNFSADQADGDFYVNNDGYGMTGCVIFRPAAIGTISAGDSFTVTIRNDTNHKILQYVVSFFQL